MRRAIVALLAVCLAACGPGMGGGGKKGKDKKGKDKKDKAAAVVPVRTVPVAIGPISRSLTGSGTLRGRYEVAVLSQATGQVVEMLVAKGDDVKQGQVLARLEDEEKRIAQAESHVALNEKRAALIKALLALRELKKSAERAMVDQMLEALEPTDTERLLGSFQAKLALKELDTAVFTGRESTISLAKSKLALQEADRALRAKEQLPKGSFSRDELERARLAQAQATQDVQRAQIALEQAQLARVHAKLELEKSLAEARQAHEAAKLGHEKATLAFRHTRIKAPITGMVYDRKIELGSRVATGATAFEMVDRSYYYVDLRLPEAELAVLHAGQRALATGNLLPSPVLGRVEQIDPAIDPATGTVGVRIRVPAGKPSPLELLGLMIPGRAFLRRGMYVRLKIEVQSHPEARLVPQEAIDFEDGRLPSVFTVKDGKARRIRVALGFSRENEVEIITEDLQEGDPVIIEGQKSVKDGGPVKVVS